MRWKFKIACDPSSIPSHSHDSITPRSSPPMTLNRWCVFPARAMCLSPRISAKRVYLTICWSRFLKQIPRNLCVTSRLFAARFLLHFVLRSIPFEVTDMKTKFRRFTICFSVLLAFPFLLSATTTIPAGTSISVTTSHTVSSKTAKVGQGVVGNVSSDVTAGGKVVIPKGSPAKLVVASVQRSGRLSTPAKLWLKLRSVTVNGKTILVATSLAGQTAGGKAKRDTVFIEIGRAHV